jgi:protein SCO1/2
MIVKGFVRAAPRVLACAALLALGAAGCGAGSNGQSAAERVKATGFRGIMLERPVEKGDFTLTALDGQPYHFRAETEGFITLLFFGYTSCPDVCPVHMANLAAVIKDLPWSVRTQIRVVFVTTDPERDTPARIREWLDAFDPQFVGLTGSREEVNRIQTGLGLPPAVSQDRPGGGYAVGHASQVLAFGRDNIARLAYPFGTRQADWAYDLPKLVRDEPVTSGADPSTAADDAAHAAHGEH